MEWKDISELAGDKEVIDIVTELLVKTKEAGDEHDEVFPLIVLVNKEMEVFRSIYLNKKGFGRHIPFHAVTHYCVVKPTARHV